MQRRSMLMAQSMAWGAAIALIWASVLVTVLIAGGWPRTTILVVVAGSVVFGALVGVVTELLDRRDAVRDRQRITAERDLAR